MPPPGEGADVLLDGKVLGADAKQHAVEVHQLLALVALELGARW